MASYRTTTFFRHVAAHACHPWNELADTLAAAAAVGELPDMSSLSPIRRLSELGSHAVEWVFFLDSLSGDYRAQFPPQTGDRLLATPPLQIDLDDVSLRPRCESRSHHTESSSSSRQLQAFDPRRDRRSQHVHLVLVSVNVQTLGHVECAHSAWVGRTAILQCELHRHGVTIAGIQETRVHTAGTRLGEHYTVIDAPCTAAGQNGVSLWLARDIPISAPGSPPVVIAKNDVTVAYHDPRALLVEVRKGRFRSYFLVLHAPNSGTASDDEIDTWWGALAQLVLARVPPEVAMFVLADANARLGSVVSPQVGTWRAEVENHAGAAFRAFLDRTHVALPATFQVCASPPQFIDTSSGDVSDPSCTVGEGSSDCQVSPDPSLYDPDDWHTWVTNTGVRHRID